MCKVSTFVTGVCVGMVAGALVEVMVIPRPKTRKTAVGKAMQRMGNAWKGAASGPLPKFIGFLCFSLDKAQIFGIIDRAVAAAFYMQWYRSGHNEHDWKSCCRQKRHEGSNPSHCAILTKRYRCVW